MVRSGWTAWSLAGAFHDLALAWAFLCTAAFAAAAARILALLGGLLPLLLCTCVRPHLPCLLAFLARYPARALDHLHAAGDLWLELEKEHRELEKDLRRELEGLHYRRGGHGLQWSSVGMDLLASPPAGSSACLPAQIHTSSSRGYRSM